MNACDWPHVLAVLNLSLCLSSRFAAVHKGRVSSKRTNWKHFFFPCYELMWNSSLDRARYNHKNVLMLYYQRQSCLRLWRDETGIYEPSLRRCGLAILGSRGFGLTEMQLFQSAILMLTASHHGKNSSLNLGTSMHVFLLMCALP